MGLMMIVDNHGTVENHRQETQTNQIPIILLILHPINIPKRILKCIPMQLLTNELLNAKTSHLETAIYLNRMWYVS